MKEKILEILNKYSQFYQSQLLRDNCTKELTALFKEQRRDDLQRYEIFKAVNQLNDSSRTYEDIIDEYLEP